MEVPDSTRRLEMSWENVLLHSSRIPLIDSLRRDEAFGRHVKAWVAFCARAFPNSVTFATLHRMPFPEILDIWSDQSGKDREDTVEGMWRPFRARVLFRPHHQLLCTPTGVLAKFKAIQRDFALDARILLIGDDDQLSLALARAGFLNVTVVDIDARLVKALERAMGKMIRIRVHDLNNRPAPDLIDDYALIVMDPPYSIEGIRLFMDGARRLSRAHSSPQIHLYCATACLGREGFREFLRMIADAGRVVSSFEGGVCRYPYSRLARAGFTLLYAAVTVLFGRRHLFDGSLIPRHISSDRWKIR